MKKYKFFNVLTLGLILGLSACNDMEQLPANKFTNSTFWSSMNNAEAILNSAYARMYPADRMLNDEALGDNVYDHTSSNTDIRVWHEGYAVGDLRMFSSEWQTNYQTIKDIHIFLANIDNVKDGSSERKEHLKAEARFIRAYAYLRLITFFGDVPFFTKDITNEEAHQIERTSRDVIMNFIHQELSEIEELLPLNTELADIDRGRITKAAATLLNARAYLKDNEWSRAQECLEKIINGHSGSYDLFKSYAGLFEVENEYNEEVILDVSYAENVRTWSTIQFFGPLSAGGTGCIRPIRASLVDSYLTLGGYTIDEADTDFDPKNPYENRDPRMTATVVYDGHKFKELKGWGPDVIYTNPNGGTIDSYDPSKINTSRTGFYTAKYFCPPVPGNNNTGINIIMMRYAEVLLAYAECANELGTINADIWNKTIKLIRQRAGFTANKALEFPANASQHDIRNIIRQEYRSEFAMEGRRYFDILRWKIGPETLNGPVRGAYFIPDIIDNFIFNDPRSYLYPIPETERSLNKNLTQNPGYN